MTNKFASNINSRIYAYLVFKIYYKIATCCSLYDYERDARQGAALARGALVTDVYVVEITTPFVHDLINNALIRIDPSPVSETV